jgi:hypothetical protein
MRLGAGGECGDLLVPDMDPVDLSLTADRIRQAVEAVAYNPIDPLDAGHRQRLGELICNRRHAGSRLRGGFAHVCGPPMPSARSFLPRLFLDCAVGGPPQFQLEPRSRHPPSAIIR